MMKKIRGAKFGAKTKKNLLTDDEIELLFRHCRSFKEKFVIYVLLYTGMRVSEFIHMRRDWIDWDAGWINIPEMQPCNKCYECKKRGGIWKVKVPEASRKIPILPEIRKILETFFKRYNAVMDLVKNRIEAWEIVKEVSERAGIKHRVFPHVLRGTFASILAGKGFSVYAVQAALGWKSFKTADDYIRLSPHRLKREFEEKW